MKTDAPCSWFYGSAVQLSHRTDGAFRFAFIQWEKGDSDGRGTVAAWCHLLDTGAVQVRLSYCMEVLFLGLGQSMHASLFYQSEVPSIPPSKGEVLSTVFGAI